jgi:anti-sigma regulatory factor (Ser/Thr protein kinase)
MGATKLKHFDVRRWAIDAVRDRHGRELSSMLAKNFGVSRITAARHLKVLVQEKWLASSGGTRPVYSLGENRQVTKEYTLPGIDESVIWVHDFAPIFDFKENVANIAHYGFTEMMNNANDHSEGTRVVVSVATRDGVLRIAIVDNGLGIFEKISRAMSLPDKRLAILELSKGKFTTDPSKHSGEGIFFTSRMFDRFQIEANDLHYNHDVRDEHDWLLEIDDRTKYGTAIYMSISLNSDRTSKQTFDEFSSDDDDYGFDKTVVPVRLAKIGNENLVSRSQAKRLVARFEGFKTVLLDFNGIEEIGQSFADEIFRVFASTHAGVELVPIYASDSVKQMIHRARGHDAA